MNPSSRETPNSGPEPAGEQFQLPSSEGGGESDPSKTPEKAVSAPEKAPGSPKSPLIASVAAKPVSTPKAKNAQTDVSSTSQTTSSLPLDDTDLIEKEWVNKAKQIVERTRDDPHKQSEELTLVKADYMKQRYNKTIKVNK